MSCEKFEERLNDLLDRRLTREEEAQLRVHLASCGRCGETMRDLEELLAMTRALPEEAPPAGFADSVMKSVHADEGRARRSRFRLISLGAVGSIAAGFLLFVLMQPSMDVKSGSSPASQSEISLAKSSEGNASYSVERRLGSDRARLVEVSPEGRRESAKRSSDEKSAAGLDLERDDKSAHAADPNSVSDYSIVSEMSDAKEEADSADGFAKQESAQKDQQARSKTTEESKTESYFYAFVEKDEAESLLRASLKSIEKANPEKKNKEAAESEKAPENSPAGAQSPEPEKERLFLMGVPAQKAESRENTIRYRIPKSQLASLQEQWKKIPGLQMQVASPPAPPGPAAGLTSGGKTAPGRAGGAPAKDETPKPATPPQPAAPAEKSAQPQNEQKKSPGTYRGPSDTVKPDGEDWIEIVIYVLHVPDPGKPK